VTRRTLAQSRALQRVLSITTVAAAVGYPVVFVVLGDGDIDARLSFLIVPVGLAGWTFGIRAALLVTTLELAAVIVIGLQRGAGAGVLAAQGAVPITLLVLAVGIAMGHLRAVREDLTQRAREAEALAGATVAIVAGTGARETLQGILTAAIGVVPSLVAAFIVSDASGEVLHVAATLGGLNDYLGVPYPTTTGITGRAWRTGEIQRVDDIRTDPDHTLVPPTPHCALAVPVIRDGRTRGILYFERSVDEPYTPRDVRIMRALAGHAWIALHSEERRHELSAATDRFAAAFSAAPSGLIISTLPDGRIIDANDAFLSLVGRPREQVIGRTGIELGLTDAETSARIGVLFARDGRLLSEAVETNQLDGTTRHFLVSAEIVNIAGEAHTVTSATDVTAQRLAALDNERLALYDVLTGLPNRNLFARRVEDALTAAAPSGRPVAVVLIDLDHFKDVNDTFGHRSGDRLLHLVGARIRAVLPETGTVAHLGGDEFAILLEAAAPDALHVADAIRRSLEAPFDLEGHAIGVSASIGISFFPEHGDTESALLQRADIALYGAKATGGGTMVYAAALDAHSPARLALTAELRAAIVSSQLVLHYQPISTCVPGAARASKRSCAGRIRIAASSRRGISSPQPSVPG
jgi:diguanylate cyclase (GGDEF)-like protein/PAS domain S-box-containing protein